MQLEKSSVTAQVSQSELPIELQPKQISIIDSNAMLEKTSLGGVQDVLESVPGINFARQGAINGQINIRGQNSRDWRSTVMIDGVPFAGRNTAEFNMFDPYSFDSIEVLRGSGSFLWGSSSINGIVNFRTRRSNYNLQGESFKATARVRSLEYQSVNDGVAGRAEVLGGGGGWDLLIGANGRMGGDYTSPVQSDGKYLKVANSGYQGYGVDFNAGYTTKSSVRYYLQGRYTNVSAERAGGTAAAPGSSYQISATNTNKIRLEDSPSIEYYLRAGAEAKDLGFADSMEAYLYYRHLDSQILYANQNRKRETFDNNFIGGRLLFDSHIGKHTLSYGADFMSEISLTPGNEINTATNVITTRNRAYTNTNFAVFVKDDYKVFEPWILSGAIRGDYLYTWISKRHSDQEGNWANRFNQAEISALIDENNKIHTGALTGSLGSVVFLGSYFSNVFNISHNFRAPQISERIGNTYSGGGSSTAAQSILANPNIKPEYSQTAEFGFRFHSENHFVSLIGFFTNYHNMRARNPYTTQAGDATFRYENVGKAYITGAELEGNHSFGESGLVELNYAFAYLHGHNVTDNKPIKHIAPFSGNLSLRLNFNKAYLSVRERYYAPKKRIDSANEIATKGYAMTDIHLGIKLGAFNHYLKDMEIIVGVSNLFNEIGINPASEWTRTTLPLADPINLTNPLIEPGRNFVAKYVWKY
ncbi:TonB-dependent receptor [Helicobacter sp. 23-1046]